MIQGFQLEEPDTVHSHREFTAQSRVAVADISRPKSVEPFGKFFFFKSKSVSVYKYRCVHHIYVWSYHMFTEIKCVQDLEFKSQWLWWVAQFRNYWSGIHGTKQSVWEGRWKPEIHDCKILAGGSALCIPHLCSLWPGPSTCAPGKTFTPELCWIELRVMELTMLCIWGEGCSVFLTEMRNKKCYTEGEHSNVKRTHVLEAFSGLKCSQPCWY